MTMLRRCAAFALLSLCCSCVESATESEPEPGAALAADPYVYVSGFSPELSRYRLNRESGELYDEHRVRLEGSPSYLAIDAHARRLYAVNEQQRGIVQAFSLDPERGTVQPLDTVSSEGDGPTHLTLAASGQWVLVANYGDGAVASFAVRRDGSLTTATTHFKAGKNAHEVVFDPSGKHLYVPCLGSDYIAQYSFNAQTGAVTPSSPPVVGTAAEAGPRHLAMHPSGRFAFSIQELNSTITAYALHPQTGALSPLQTVSSLPAGYRGKNSAAEIAVHPSGRFLYASNRGDDSVTVFKVDPLTGMMSWVARQGSGGKTPRSFAIDDSGKFLLVVNQGTSDVTVFRIDQMRGELSPVFSLPTTKAPSFVGLTSFSSL